MKGLSTGLCEKDENNLVERFRLPKEFDKDDKEKSILLILMLDYKTHIVIASILRFVVMGLVRYECMWMRVIAFGAKVN